MTGTSTTRERLCAESAEFLKRTSMHGLGMVAVSSSRSRRLVWVLLVALACLGFFLHLISVIRHYRLHPVTVERLAGGTEFVYPDVTLCQMGDFPEQLVYTSPIYSQTVHLQSLLFQSLTTAALSYHVISSSSSLPAHADFHKALAWVYEAMPGIRFASLDQRTLTPGKQEVVLWCKFRDVDCYPANFTAAFYPKYTGCYTLKLSEFEQSWTGVGRQGLSLILFVPEDSSSNMASQSIGTTLERSTGLSLTIHPARSQPYPSESFIQLSTGHSSSIRVRMVRRKRVDIGPRRRCVRRGTLRDVVDHITGEVHHRIYDIRGCYTERYQSHLFEQCGCISYLYPISSHFHKFDLCHYYNFSGHTTNTTELHWEITHLIDRIQCHDREMKTLGQLAIQKSLCKAPCVDVQYFRSMSVTRWPLNSALVPLWTMLRSRYESSTSSHRLGSRLLRSFAGQFHHANASRLIRRHLVYLELGPAEGPRADLETEQAAYTADKLWADIGGGFGLWVGISLLTLCELVDLLVSLVWTGMLRAYRRTGYWEPGEAGHSSAGN